MLGGGESFEQMRTGHARSGDNLSEVRKVIKGLQKSRAKVDGAVIEKIRRLEK